MQRLPELGEARPILATSLMPRCLAFGLAPKPAPCFSRLLADPSRPALLAPQGEAGLERRR